MTENIVELHDRKKQQNYMINITVGPQDRYVVELHEGTRVEVYDR